ncbi:beta-galactosidase [Aequitasia blattaphilus]|uniref:DUF4982 domain-containing protein n=1 Tax=Aequitasia blattaphilus TaxID=2949332 RepID=A0ABT1EBK2_9FIRM|nr:glycoside hydrolase family 2 TIM barrel-domain containing protein [Aequitasia blattaphilus]MCP1103220.1 DUF4982 domain-containing protein [Aequitasia blattaphilus]MCR8615860.1 DUF4982 domain-containing protein [Aequitasia blattaphilus]
MKRIDFNRGWEVLHKDEENAFRKQVTLPHDAMLGEKRTKNSLGGIHTGWFEGYDYLYEKYFEVPLEMEDQRVIFEFEGVYHNAEVYLNGKKAAFRPYGYSNFYVSADSYLKYGKTNQMQVIARNKDQPNSRWYSGAGIYRPVWMYVAEKHHILLNGIKVRTLSIEPAIIEIKVDTTTQGSVQIEIPEAGIQTEIPSGEMTAIQIDNAKLWSVDSPYLYTCKAFFEEDTVTETFGIRQLEWDSKQGFKMNGRREILRGACIHHDNGILGACCFPEAVERKIRILKENGYNAIRSAHNPCSKALLDACDRQGMLVVDEFVDVWYIHKTEYDYVDYFMKWWKQDLKDMVDKDYNHPCVIMYSTGNEVSETAQKKGIDLAGQMTKYLHILDSSRPVTCGVNIFFNFLSSIGLGVYSDKKAKKKAVGSEFFNNLAGLLGRDVMKIGASFYGCDVKTHKAFANLDIAGYNYGIKRYRKDLNKYSNRLILGSETFCSDAYDFWEMAKKNNRLIGDFVWAGMDYLGEVGVGAWEYRDYAPDFSHGVGWITAGSGRIDLTGKPLAEAGYTKVAFEQTDKPVIAVVPVNHTGDKHSPSAWKMTNGIESWSFRGYSGKKAIVEVYARAAEIELLINGKRAGRKRLKNKCDTVFHTVYQNGTIEAVAYNSKGQEIARTRLKTAKTDTEIQIVPEENVAKKGKLSFIRLKYTDKEGTLKPLMGGTLKMKVENAELIAFGNACPFNKRGYLTNQTDAYYGEALAVIRANGSGNVRMKVTDGRLSSEYILPLSV